MYQIAREKHLSVEAINPRVPPVVEKIIDKALEKDPENGIRGPDRWQNTSGW